MVEVVDSIMQSRNFVPLLIFTGVILLAAIRTVGAVLRTSARERSRREIAAYIAEGTMTPEQGERLIRAGDDEPTC